MSHSEEHRRKISESLKARYERDPGMREQVRMAGAKSSAARARNNIRRRETNEELLEEIRGLRSEIEDLRSYLLWDSAGGGR